MPAPLGPVSAIRSPGRMAQADVVQGIVLASRVGERDCAQPDGVLAQVHGAADARARRRCRWRRGVEDLEDVPGRGGALGAGVELRADRAQREVGLGREQQHEQCGLVAHVPGQQAQPDLHRDERGGQRGRQFQHEAGQERDAQRGHGGGPVLVGDPADHLGLALAPAEQLERGQALHHVEEVAAEPGQQPPLALGDRLGVPTDQDGEERDQRQGERR